MITSKRIIKIINEKSGHSLFLGMSTDASKEVSSKAVQNSRTKEFKKDGSTLPTGKTELTNFIYSPLEGTCTWYEMWVRG